MRERKFIVFESCLQSLLALCFLCGNACKIISTKVSGTMVTLTSQCSVDPSHVKTWKSQPSHGTMPLGNLQLAASIMFSGCSTVKAVNCFKFMRISTFCVSTYYNIQKAYLIPAVNSLWSKKQELLICDVKKKSKVRLGGDARCCSPGHTAKYGSYSLMDMDTSKVLDMQLVQCTEVKNSYAMELEGLKRSLQFLEDAGVTVTDLTTDRHSSVKKFMREIYPSINHWFDAWHIAKGITKKLDASSKKKLCHTISPWIHSISNHVYWCGASSDGNAELVVAKWKSVMNHIVDIHEHPFENFPTCAHDELVEDREWIAEGEKLFSAFSKVNLLRAFHNTSFTITAGSRAHVEVKSIVTNRTLLADIGKLSPHVQTSSVESYHKVVCFFAPKFLHFFYHSMNARLMLAILHFNENSNRQQAKNKAGKEMWQLSFPKAKKGEPVAKQVKVPCTYGVYLV
ncbi:uncharacterized protein LOC118564855 isoform X1 [Fundulus heteroclitus]|uniref:uncharacterized protein LOC118564855 isoform X1 n=2 Tax=Fundulus heteroclitus TaxID=8078 RepID=UPI00165CE723|nr:uncharacterized protein LOC118564855 isoform X1 [Fundulus heteroclitus]